MARRCASVSESPDCCTGRAGAAAAVFGGAPAPPSAQSAMMKAAAPASASQLSASNWRSARMSPDWNSMLACQRPAVGPRTPTTATNGASSGPAVARFRFTLAATAAAVGQPGGACQVSAIGSACAAPTRAPPSTIAASSAEARAPLTRGRRATLLRSG